MVGMRGVAGVRRRMQMLMVVIALALTGCSNAGVMPPVGLNTQPVTITFTIAEAQAIMDAYNSVNNLAIDQASRPPYDPKVWQAPDAGPALQTDQFDTALAKQRKQTKKESVQRSSTVLSVHGPTQVSYPRFLMIVHTDQDARGKTLHPEGQATLSTMVQQREGAMWQLWSSVGVYLKQLPAASAGPEDQHWAANQKRGEQLAQDYITLLTTGHSDAVERGLLAKTDAADFFKQGPLKDRKTGAHWTRTLSVKAWSKVGRWSAQSFPTADGLLISVGLQVVVTQAAVGDAQLWFTDKDEAVVLGQPGERKVLTYPAVVTLLIHAPAKGKPTCLAFRQDAVLP